jgi:hypothetical protein
MWNETIMAQLQALSWHLPGGAEENNENVSQDSRSPGWDLNLGPPKHEEKCKPLDREVQSSHVESLYVGGRYVPYVGGGSDENEFSKIFSGDQTRQSWVKTDVSENYFLHHQDRLWWRQQFSETSVLTQLWRVWSPEKILVYSFVVKASRLTFKTN